MKTNIKYILLAVLGMGTLASCSLDLEPTTDKAYVEGKPAFNSFAELKAFENGLNAAFRKTFYGIQTEAAEVMCDGFNATVSYGNNLGAIHRTDMTFVSTDMDVLELWKNHYDGIKNYNFFLQNLPLYKPTTKKEAEYAKMAKGEAFFYRAYSYLELVRHFAKQWNAATANTDLGMPLVLVYDQQAKPSRATIAETYKQIKSDLDSAAVYLQNIQGKVRADRPTIDAVNALYARYYLDVKDYAKAVEMSEKVIKSNAAYQLASTAEEMMEEYRNDNGKEPIMQLAATATENGSGTNDYYTMSEYNKDYESTMNGIYFSPYYLPSKKLVESYDRGDLRFGQWFSNEYINHLQSSVSKGKFYTFVRYLGNPKLSTSNVPNGRQHVKPFLLGEMYLINAEANAMAGNGEAAKKSLQALQQARKAATTDATMENIKKEWFRETPGEGFRMICLKRWGDGFQGRDGQQGANDEAVLVTGKNNQDKVMPSNDDHWAWPIPDHEIFVNGNLKQNKGY